jgi:hypothetical protein
MSGEDTPVKYMRILICLAMSGLTAAWLDPGLQSREQATVPSPSRAKVHNREMSALTEGNRHGLQLDERNGDGFAWWPDVVFGDGVIELDVRGKDVAQRSFVGVAFHGAGEDTFDAVYFRPFNFKAGDPVRRSHGVQYVSHPTFTWDKLRAERPDQFEHDVSPAPDPNGWFHVRVLVKHPQVRVFVDGREAPSLEVKQLSNRGRGWVGVWVGNGSGGSFANLQLTPAQ